MILKYASSSFKELAGSSSARCMRAIWPLSLLSHPALLSEAPAVSQWSLLLFSVTFVLVSCTHSTHAHSALTVVAQASRDSLVDHRSPSQSHHRWPYSALDHFKLTRSCAPPKHWFENHWPPPVHPRSSGMKWRRSSSTCTMPRLCGFQSQSFGLCPGISTTPNPRREEVSCGTVPA